MCAPSRFPPWVIIVPTSDNKFSTAIGPQAFPCVVFILSPNGRISLNENPIPPPNFYIIACSDAAVIIPCMLSSISST